MEENNKLIAEFLGQKGDVLQFPKFGYITTSGNWKDEFTPNELKFHKDWNWLMEVVKKIRNNPIVTNVNYNIEGDFIIEGLTSAEKLDIIINREDFKSDLEMCYFGVVEFIKWYNLNSEKGK